MAIARVLSRLLVSVPLALAVLWGAAAIWIDGPSERWLAGTLAVAFLVLSALPWMLRQTSLVRVLATLAPFALVLAWWSFIPPSNDRDWLPDVARLPVAEIQGNRLTVHNVRNFVYGASDTDFTAQWETRRYDLSQITGLDLFISYWGPTLYAHTIMSWEFADGQHLSISIETRKEMGESYSAVLGFFRQYELYYVVGDERDLIGVRADHRGEQVYLYRLRTPPTAAKALLLHYLQEANRLAQSPKWYNAWSHNCTTVIVHHIEALAPGHIPWDWRVLVNGYLDQFAYERGGINTDLSFDELRRRSDITAKARAAGTSPDFSRLIRESLPARPQVPNRSDTSSAAVQPRHPQGNPGLDVRGK